MVKRTRKAKAKVIEGEITLRDLKRVKGGLGFFFKRWRGKVINGTLRW